MQPPSTTRGTVQLLHRSFIRFRDRLHVLSHVLLTKTLRGVARSFHFKYLRQFNTLLYLPFMALEIRNKRYSSVWYSFLPAFLANGEVSREAASLVLCTENTIGTLSECSNAMNAKVFPVGKHKVRQCVFLI